MKEIVFSTNEVGQICNVHQTTVINWIHDGKLKAYTTPGGHRRIKKATLFAFMKEYKIPIPENLMKKKKTVLVVDDDLEMLNELKLALSGNGFDLDLASSGFEAALIIFSKKPDLILLDFKMPGMDGFAVCDILRKNKETAGIPIFAVTVLKSDKDRARIKKSGVFAYVQKPFDTKKLLILIKDALKINKKERM